MNYNYPGDIKITITSYDSLGNPSKEDDGYISREDFFDIFIKKQNKQFEFFSVESRKYLSEIEILIDDIDKLIKKINLLLYREKDKFIFNLNFEL